MLNEQFFFTSPVQVVKVTNENLEEAAEWCGGRVAETESRNERRKAKGELDKYVWVPTPEGAKIGMAFPGMYITKRVVVTNQRVGDNWKTVLKVTWAVFAKWYFETNYFETPVAAIDATWGKKLTKAETENVKVGSGQKPAPAVVNITVSSMADAEKIVREGLGGVPVPGGDINGVVEGTRKVLLEADGLPRDASL